MNATDLSYTPALELGRLYRAKKLSPVEVTDAVLTRVERLNPKLNAYLTVTADHARELARAAEARFARGEAAAPWTASPTPSWISSRRRASARRTGRSSSSTTCRPKTARWRHASAPRAACSSARPTRLTSATRTCATT